MSKWLVLALLAAAPACSDPPPVTGTLMGQPFVARGGYFTTMPDSIEPGVTDVLLEFYDYAYCAVLDSTLEQPPQQYMNVSAVLPSNVAPQQFSLSDGDAVAGMDVYTNGKTFTGGTISLATASTDEVTGSLVLSTVDGDYVSGNFSLRDCARL